MASVVAMKVFGTVMTASPAATPAAESANLSASVPLPTPTQKRVSQNAANSRSKPSTIGPPMKPAVLSASWKAATSSSFNSAWGVTKSRKGIFASFVIFKSLE